MGRSLEKDGFEFERTFGWLLDDTYRLTRRAFDRRVRKAGLSQPQARILAHLYREDGLTQTALADLVEMEKAPLGRLLDRLEEAGWVERRPDPNDRRARRIYITDKVESVLSTMKAAARETFSDALKGFSERDVGRLITLMEALKANLVAAEVSASESRSEKKSEKKAARQAAE